MDEKISDIGIFGAGVSNSGVLTYLKEVGKKFRLTVRQTTPMRISELNSLGADIALFGDMARCGFTEDELYLSPTVRRDGLSAPQTCRMTSDTELFFERYRGSTVAVTGSDGKSTTTEMILRLLLKAGKRAEKIGNCGSALCSSLSSQNEYSVAELSSFQLMHYAPKTERAVITNITENHLDMHRSFEEYRDAKLALAALTDGLVFDADCELLSSTVYRKAPLAVCSFTDDVRTLMRTVRAENYITYSEDTVFINGKAALSTLNFSRRESYNIKNAMLAIGATLGIADESCYGELTEFEGLLHRAKCILDTGRIRYVDSSIDTTPTRTARTLSQMDGRIALIITGRGKGLSYAPLLQIMREKCALTVVVSDAGNELLEAALRDGRYEDFTFIKAHGMYSAVKAATEALGCGTVLLSPSAASYDKYKNYIERAEDFKNCAALLTKEKQKDL